ncbi:unnamed protein product, partial [Rotaria socialis]
ILIGAIGLGLTLIRHQPLTTMIILFTVTSIGTKAYLPAFWSLPSLFLSESAAASSIGFINSIGNLGVCFTAVIVMILRFDRHYREEPHKNIRHPTISSNSNELFTSEQQHTEQRSLFISVLFIIITRELK